MARVTVYFYAGAADAAGAKSQVHDADTVRELIAQLGRDKAALAPIVDASTILINGESHATSSDSKLEDGFAVDILPPYAGG